MWRVRCYCFQTFSSWMLTFWCSLTNGIKLTTAGTTTDKHLIASVSFQTNIVHQWQNHEGYTQEVPLQNVILRDVTKSSVKFSHEHVVSIFMEKDKGNRPVSPKRLTTYWTTRGYNNTRRFHSYENLTFYILYYLFQIRFAQKQKHAIPCAVPTVLFPNLIWPTKTFVRNPKIKCLYMKLRHSSTKRMEE
jgi:hypothetical protein